MHAQLLQLCLTLWDLMDCSLPGSSIHGILQARTPRVGCHALLQGIFLTQRLNPHLLCLPHRQVGSLPLAPPGTPISVTQWCPTVCDPWTAAHQVSLSITNSRSLLRLMAIEPVMPSNHLILCHPLLLPPSIFPSNSFLMSWLFASGGQSIGTSASASVLPMNIQA